MTHKLILLRHGESEWNKVNRFTGWVDVRLSEKGKREAVRAGELLREHSCLPDVVHTSVLSRAIQTANLALDSADRLWVPCSRSWRLNERHYGELQGKNKAEILKTFGQEQFDEWRRAFDVSPPPIAIENPHSQRGDPRYSNIGDFVPLTESLKIVIDRLIPYWKSEIVPDISLGKVTLVVAHGNSLRGLVKYLEGIDDEAISQLNIPTGIPLIYELGRNLKPKSKGHYLDSEAAKKGAAMVLAQGKKKS